MVFDRPVRPWRFSLADVQADAVATGNGSVDEQLDLFFITVPAWLDYQNLAEGWGLRNGRRYVIPAGQSKSRGRRRASRPRAHRSA